MPGVIEQRDFPAKAVARRLGLPEIIFLQLLPELYARGFPKVDPTTGQFDLDAVDEWRRSRHPHLFSGKVEQARDARYVMSDRFEKMRNG